MNNSDEAETWDMWVDVVEVKPNGTVLLRVLPGHAGAHAELIETQPAKPHAG